jgi:hypothetical protein
VIRILRTIPFHSLTNGMEGGIVQLLAFIFMQETYPVVLLERRAKRLRKETGNNKLQSALSRGFSHKELFSRSIIRPVGSMSLYELNFWLIPEIDENGA